MKITDVHIEGFQGINWLDLHIKTPILLVSGANNSGKSSLVNAISFAVTGSTARVKLKKDYKELVHEGADSKKSHVSVKTANINYARTVSTGKFGHGCVAADSPFLFPYLDGTVKYADLDRKQRQELITETTGVKADRDAVVALMVQRGISDEAIEMTLPLLRSGFEAAHKQAKSKESECKGAWSATTNEKYGSAKAPSWEAESVDLSGVAKLEETIANNKSDIADTTAKLAQVRQKVQGQADNHGTKTQCPECDAWLWFHGGKATKHVETGVTPATYTKYEKAIIKGEGVLRGLQGSLAFSQAELKALMDTSKADEITKKALGYHNQVESWNRVADALSPNGIPLEIVNTIITPLNVHLAQTSTLTGWGQVVIRPDLELTVGGRLYNLLSESEKWRADIAMSEMISKVSGLGIFIADRFDVLSLPNRAKCLGWLMKVCENHETIIILGTLKALPEKLPPKVSGLWLEYGKQQEA